MTAATDDKTFTEADVVLAVNAVRSARKAGRKTEIAAGVSANVADAISKIDDLVDELMDHLGIPDKDADAGKGDTAALAAAQARIADLESQIAADGEAEMQAKIDALTVELNAEKEQQAATVAFLEAEAAAQAEAVAMQARSADRLAKIKELAVFTDEQLDEKAVADGPTRAERYAAMSDEAFEAAVEALELHKGAAATQGPPRKTALVASADEGKPSGAGKSLAATVAARRKTTDLSRLIGR